MSSRPHRTSWSRRRWVLVIGAVLLVAALIAAWFAFAPRGAQEPATQVVRATRGNETTTVSLSGVLAPQQQANVSFAVPGTVRSVPARVGERVTEGQQLAAVDDRDLRNAVDLASAQLNASRAQVNTARDAGASSAQLEAARAGVRSAEAGLEQARTRLADAVLTAPLTGVVAEVNVEVGDQVAGGGLGSAGLGGGSLGGATAPRSGSAGGGLQLPAGMGADVGAGASGGAAVVIVVPDAWKLDATVGTADLSALKQGQPAVVTPTGTDQHVSAVVDTVGIIAERSGGAASFPVTLKITDASAHLFSGADAEAVVTTADVPGVLSVPAEAVTVADGRATVRRPGGAVTPVTTGRRFGDRTEITDGLAEGDEILAPRGVVVTRPPRPQFGPGGTMASPDPSGTPRR